MVPPARPPHKKRPVRSWCGLALVIGGQGGDHVRMPEPSLRESYEAIIRAVAARDLAVLDRLLDEGVTDHNAVPGQAPGRAGITFWVTMMHDAFGDLVGVVEDTVVEGDRVAARVTWHGTHRGDFVGVPGTGLPVTMQSIQILGFTNGLVSDWWGTADVWGVLQQIDAAVVLPESRSSTT